MASATYFSVASWAGALTEMNSTMIRVMSCTTGSRKRNYFKKEFCVSKGGIREYKVAMLCAEENPAACHRRLLIGRVLINRGIQVDHIRGDGRIQTEAEVAAETNPNKDQLALFEKVEAEPWKSIPAIRS